MSAGDAEEVSTVQTAACSFWQNHNGQELQASLNGSPDSTMLATYLADTFLDTYGSFANANGDGNGGDYITSTDVSGLHQDMTNETADRYPLVRASLTLR